MLLKLLSLIVKTSANAKIGGVTFLGILLKALGSRIAGAFTSLKSLVGKVLTKVVGLLAKGYTLAATLPIIGPFGTGFIMGLITGWVFLAFHEFATTDALGTNKTPIELLREWLLGVGDPPAPNLPDSPPLIDHVVQKDETLFRISLAYNSTIVEFIAANPCPPNTSYSAYRANPNYIICDYDGNLGTITLFPNQRLCIPGIPCPAGSSRLPDENRPVLVKNNDQHAHEQHPYTKSSFSKQFWHLSKIAHQENLTATDLISSPNPIMNSYLSLPGVSNDTSSAAIIYEGSKMYDDGLLTFDLTTNHTRLDGYMSLPPQSRTGEQIEFDTIVAVSGTVQLPSGEVIGKGQVTVWGFNDILDLSGLKCNLHCAR